MGHKELLPEESPWTCPSDRVLGDYKALKWFSGVAIGPVIVWLLHKAFPNQSRIPLINLSLILLGATRMKRLYFVSGLQNLILTWWGTDGEHCCPATCPKVKGIVVDGCPVF